MTDQEAVCRLLYSALLEIRVVGWELEDRKLIELADLFHNIPLHINCVAGQEGNWREIMTNIQQRAKDKPVEAWLAHTVQHNFEGATPCPQFLRILKFRLPISCLA